MPHEGREGPFVFWASDFWNDPLVRRLPDGAAVIYQAMLALAWQRAPYEGAPRLLADVKALLRDLRLPAKWRRLVEAVVDPAAGLWYVETVAETPEQSTGIDGESAADRQGIGEGSAKDRQSIGKVSAKYWRNRRLDREWSAVLEQRSNRSQRAATGGRAKAEKARQSNDSGNPAAVSNPAYSTPQAADKQPVSSGQAAEKQCFGPADLLAPSPSPSTSPSMGEPLVASPPASPSETQPNGGSLRSPPAARASAAPPVAPRRQSPAAQRVRAHIRQLLAADHVTLLPRDWDLRMGSVVERLLRGGLDPDGVLAAWAWARASPYWRDRVVQPGGFACAVPAWQSAGGVHALRPPRARDRPGQPDADQAILAWLGGEERSDGPAGVGGHCGVSDAGVSALAD